MDQRIGVDAFNRRRRPDQPILIRLKQPPGLDQQEGPQAFSASEGGIAHGVMKARFGPARGRQQRIKGKADPLSGMAEAVSQISHRVALHRVGPASKQGKASAMLMSFPDRIVARQK
jgi:hypothetical protein